MTLWRRLSQVWLSLWCSHRFLRRASDLDESSVFHSVFRPRPVMYGWQCLNCMACWLMDSAWRPEHDRRVDSTGSMDGQRVWRMVNYARACDAKRTAGRAD